MEWDWGAPVAVGLFLLMAGGTMVLTSIAIALFTGGAKVSDLLSFRRR